MSTPGPRDANNIFIPLGAFRPTPEANRQREPYKLLSEIQTAVTVRRRQYYTFLLIFHTRYLIYNTSIDSNSLNT